MSVLDGQAPPDEQVGPVEDVRDRGAFLPKWARYLVTPGVVTASFLALYLYMSARDLGGIERRVLTYPVIRARTIEHIDISFWATVIVLSLAIPTGIMLTRPWARRVTPLFVGLANIGQGVPSIGTFVLVFLILTRRGRYAAIIGLAIYAFLPVLRGTMVGLQQVPWEVIKAGRGMGLNRMQVLRQIELPLSVPILLTGVRTALVLTVSTAPLAAFVQGGTLGAIIITGFAQSRFTLVVTGSVLAAGLALLADWAGGIAEDQLRPRGL
ncbi:MAG: ABC transporter permease [Actinomycetota bacterium]|nr:ABC transporter permease [Actinomycetota bacterium]